MKKKFNPFHLVSKSPWPFMMSMTTLSTMMSLILMMYKINSMLMMVSILMMTMVSAAWWRDTHRESTMEGEHTHIVMEGLKMGMILFIVSEVLFFVSMFWAFFHSSMSPSMEIGQMWPPYSINGFNPMSVPLLNTIILLSSGVTVTCSHHNMMEMKYKKAKKYMILTITMGMMFSMMQMMEYIQAPFSMSDSIFGSTFFMTTGLHGMHVMIGSLFLMISAVRFSNMYNSKTHMIGFECAAWYWHFVDLVWILVYVSMYWWGMYSF